MKTYVLTIIKIWLIICCVFILCSQSTHLFGKEVYIKTTPIDPRDLLRGNYVSLSFKELSRFEDTISEYKSASNYAKVYVLLKPDENNFVHYAGFSTERPKKGLFIKAQIHKQYYGSFNYSATYGIETYFTTPKKARELEKDLVAGGVAKVKIDKFGNAKITKIKKAIF